jgi:hypothetical protein
MNRNQERLLASIRLLLANQPPEYGSLAWHALPVDDPDRDRAVWQAAEAWRRYWTREAIAERLRRELDLIDRVTLERFKEASADVSRAWDMSARCTGPSHAELQRRRRLTSWLPCGVCGEQVELVHPLPDDLAEHLPDASRVRCRAHRLQANGMETAA